MKLLAIFSAVSAVLISSAAIAADNLPIQFKALGSASPCQVSVPASGTTPATPLSCSGPYVGLGLGGQGSNANIIGNGINGSVFAAGITPSVDIGYQYVQGNWLFGAEFNMAYAVGTKAVVNNVGNGFDGLRLTEVFKVGGNLSGLLGTQAAITIPPQLANSVLAPYVHVGTTQWQLAGSWANGITSGAGVEFDVSPMIWGDLRYTYTNFAAARSGGLVINDDNSLLMTINFKLR